jgi:hypothetical protein
MIWWKNDMKLGAGWLHAASMVCICYVHMHVCRYSVVHYAWLRFFRRCVLSKVFVCELTWKLGCGFYPDVFCVPENTVFTIDNDSLCRQFCSPSWLWTNITALVKVGGLNPALTDQPTCPSERFNQTCSFFYRLNTRRPSLVTVVAVILKVASPANCPREPSLLNVKWALRDLILAPIRISSV